MDWTLLIGPGIVLLINGTAIAYSFGKLNEKVKNNTAKAASAIDLVLEKHKEVLKTVVEKIAEYEKILGDIKEVLKIIVKDDGIGFDPEVDAGIGHNGLKNMQRRMNEIDGSFEIKSNG